MNSSVSSYVASILLLAAAPSCGSGPVCPSCGPAATLATDLPLTFEQLQRSTVTVCHNANCLSGSFASLNAPPSPGTGVGIAIASSPGGDTGRGTSGFVRATDSGALWLQVYWPSDLDALMDGDKYNVSVEESTGQALISVAWVVTSYEIVYLDGKDCAPACKHVDFDEHTP